MDFLDQLEHDGKGDYRGRLGAAHPLETTIQIVLSVVLGITGLLAFCLMRTRWDSLYAARKRQRGEASPLPDLPNTFFGWIPVLWRITEQQVLASAGLDAYVFLRFFKMAIKFLSVTLFFALIVFKPVHDSFPDKTKKPGNATDTDMLLAPSPLELYRQSGDLNVLKKNSNLFPHDYLWMYLVFAYVFTGLAIYLLVTETEHIIGIRQEYLGSRNTVTDRTIRLSGIPPSLRSEEKIKEFIENLQIGKVDSVTFCRKWQELDDLMDHRMVVLRKLEESWTVYMSNSPDATPIETLTTLQPDASQDEDDEAGPLLNGHAAPHNDPARPKTTVRYGFLKLQGREFDAIDYYEEKLRRIDEKLKELRTKEFEPMPLAFITMDSVAACQMAIQAVLDPSPMHLIAKISPEPLDVVWRNTYMPRWQRISRGWIITIAISLLTIFWSVVLVPVAGALNQKSIAKVWPELAQFLESHPFAGSLVQTQLPTLITSLLFVIVPYLYDWLANHQGMTSQGDVELSVISKNFFFLFFNYFVIFSVLGTFSNFYEFYKELQDSLKDTTRIAFFLASSLQDLLSFYTNLVILQGVGLYPFRLLEFGSVALYPIYRLFCKTPRDYAELIQPPVFSYGFYMPTVMLIYTICIVYSVMRDSWKLLLAGMLYFAIGGFVTKYQLLYAMHHPQQTTGGSWIMICNRMIVALLLFQLTIAGQVALKGAIPGSIIIFPLIIGTLWFFRSYSRTYEPLMKYISLRSIERRVSNEAQSPIDPDGWGEQAPGSEEAETQSDEVAKAVPPFVNPSLVAPLQDVWISDKDVRSTSLENPGRGRRFEGALNAAV